MFALYFQEAMALYIYIYIKYMYRVIYLSCNLWKNIPKLFHSMKINVIFKRASDNTHVTVQTARSKVLLTFLIQSISALVQCYHSEIYIKHIFSAI